jgi:23S rRNA pseudoU1915 N3-methylase RlmH
VLEELEKKLAEDYHKFTHYLKTGKDKIVNELNKNKKIAGNLKENAEQALEDLKNGSVFTDDEAAQNFKNTLLDALKAAGMTGIFILPGGSIGLIALRKLLKTKEAKQIGIENLLTLTVEAHKDEQEKNIPSTDKDNHQ